MTNAVAIAVESNSAHSVLYRVQISGTTGKVVGAVKPGRIRQAGKRCSTLLGTRA